MTVWNVKLENTEEYIKRSREWHASRGWKIREDNWYGYFQFNIDILIAIIDAYKKRGIDLRKRLENKFTDCDCYKLGKEIFNFGLVDTIKSLKDLKTMVSKTDTYKITPRFYLDLGKTIKRAYLIAERFSISGACRNDDRYRYFCKYHLNNFSYIFEDIVVKKYYKETMESEAILNRNLANITWVIANFIENVRLDYGLYSDIKNYRFESKIGLHYLSSVALKYLEAIYSCLFYSSKNEELNVEVLYILACIVLLAVQKDVQKLPELQVKLRAIRNTVENTEYDKEYSHELQRVLYNLVDIHRIYVRIVERVLSGETIGPKCIQKLNLIDTSIRKVGRIKIFI